MKKIVSYFLIFCVLFSLTGCGKTAQYTKRDLDNKPFFTYSVLKNWEPFRACIFKYRGVVESVVGDDITIRMEVHREDDTVVNVFVVVDEDKIMKNPASKWENPTVGSYAVIIGELEKIKENNYIQVAKWYYDEESVQGYSAMKELESQIKEENRIAEEEQQKYEQQKYELELITNLIDGIPNDISQIRNWINIRERLYQFTVIYPTYRDINEVNELIKSIDSTIYLLEQEKTNIENNKMTIEEGHSELDAVLVGLSNEIVDPENLEYFNSLCYRLNYDNIVGLGTALEGTINELYGIIRKPTDTTEYDKLVKRVDDFIVYCPNFAEDDVLTHKYEFIKNIILKRLEG